MPVITTALAVVASASAPLVVFDNEGKSIQSEFCLEDLQAQETELKEDSEKLNVEGYVAVWNRYVDHDSFVQVDEPVIDAYATIEVVDGLSLAVWNIQAVDPEPQVGDELYLSAIYELPVTDELLLTAEVGRSWNNGFNDIWIFSGTAEYHSFDVSITKFVVDDGPFTEEGDGENATRLQFGYTFPELGEMTTRAMVTHETGFGLSDITTVGVEAELPLTDRWSLRAEVLAPLVKRFDDDRSASITFGIAFTF